MSRAQIGNRGNGLPDSPLPYVRPLPPEWTAVDCFVKLSDRKGCVFLDSSLPHPHLGRYSYLAVDPFESWSVDCRDARSRQRSVWDQLRQSLKRFSTPTVANLPPFQGGALVLFGYELGAFFEDVPLPQSVTLGVDQAMVVGLYDVVLAFDHQSNCGWIVSSGFPELDARKRETRARARVAEIEAILRTPNGTPGSANIMSLEATVAPATGALQQSGSLVANATRVHSEAVAEVASNFSAEQYRRAIARAIQYIHAGDVFQVNLSQQLSCPATDTAANFFLALREKAPSTFGGYFAGDGWTVISASPERLVSLRNGHVEARPIKGTRRRIDRPEADMYSAADLRNSQKDRAENIMICDLLRNDLSKVCEPDSVVVTKLCGLENYGYVQHLVSVIQGQLRGGCDALDLVQAAFPGGSITGAPKLRAMEIVAELEQRTRGAYCGSMGYLGWDGSMDLNILIRTVTAREGHWTFPVGGGIVAPSDVEDEYRETWHKAAGILSAIREMKS